MEDSMTWADATAVEDEMVDGRRGREPGQRSWGGWWRWAAGWRVQLLGVEGRTRPRFSPGSCRGLKQFVLQYGHSEVCLLRSLGLLYLWVPWPCQAGQESQAGWWDHAAAGCHPSAEVVNLWRRKQKTEESTKEKSAWEAGERRRESGEDGEVVETVRFAWCLALRSCGLGRLEGRNPGPLAAQRPSACAGAAGTLWLSAGIWKRID